MSRHKADERLEEFLAARIAGPGADGQVEVDDDTEVPLLYATTSGAPYERYEIDSEIVGRPQWPWASMTVSARLFTDGDATVVEQQFSWSVDGGLRLDAHATTENGQPIIMSYTSSDDEVTVAAPSTLDDVLGREVRGTTETRTCGSGACGVGRTSWPARIASNSSTRSPTTMVRSERRLPTALRAGRTQPQIAQQLIADPNFETTAPVAARIGGVEAVSIDVTLAPGGEACGIGMIDISRWIHTIGWDDGSRLRLYLVDLPDGMSVETLAITVVAPEERFDEVIAETAPIIESIQFDPG